MHSRVQPLSVLLLRIALLPVLLNAPGVAELRREAGRTPGRRLQGRRHVARQRHLQRNLQGRQLDELLRGASLSAVVVLWNSSVERHGRTLLGGALYPKWCAKYC